MKILFVIHEADWTGAPLFILGLLEWLKREHKNIEFDVLLLSRTKPDIEFSHISKVYYWNYNPANTCTKILNKLYPEFHSKLIMSALKRNNYDLCYVNSAASCRVMKSLASMLACPFLLHVHELESGIRNSGSAESFEACVPFAKHFIGVSNAVKHNLMERYRIPEDKISVIPPVSRRLANNITERIDLKKMPGLPADAFIAGICGTLSWHKGMDLLVPLLRKISENSGNGKIFFVWVGETCPQYQKILEYDLERLGLADKVRFAGKTPNALSYMAEFDILLLLSREESFSLVAAEASALGKTVLCFENVIGWTEYASPDAYIAVPYLDLDKMANTIIELSQGKRIHSGSDANSSNYAAEKVLPEIFDRIMNCVK